MPIRRGALARAVAGGLLEVVNVASLALMAVVTWRLATTALVDWLTVLIAAARAVLLFRHRANSAWLVFCGAVVGLLARLLHA